MVIVLAYIRKVSWYDQEIPQSHTADQPMQPCWRVIESEFVIDLIEIDQW